MGSPIRDITDVVDDYRHGADRPLGAYAGLLALYGGAVVGLSELTRRRGRRLPVLCFGDIALLGVATHKIARRLAKDPVTSPLRAPFTRFRGTSGPAELDEEVVGSGLRKAVGELVTCPFCLSQWIATSLVYGFVLAPRATRLGASVFAGLAIADFLQFAYARAEQREQSG